MSELTIEDLRKVRDDFISSYAPPPKLFSGPLTDRARLLFPEKPPKRNFIFGGISIVVSPVVPSDVVVAVYPGRRVEVMPLFPSKLGAPNHRKLRWNRKRRHKRHLQTVGAMMALMVDAEISLYNSFNNVEVTGETNHEPT